MCGTGETPPLPPEPPEYEPREPDCTPPPDSPVPLLSPVVERSKSSSRRQSAEGKAHRRPSTHGSPLAGDSKTGSHKRLPTKEREKPNHAALSTSDLRRRRDEFRSRLSTFVVALLNPYHKADCKTGRITSADDFKYLARKLTHGIVDKELQRKSADELEMSESVRFKTQEFVKNYMKKFGKEYART